ncbi:phosphoribosylanthranilate isomerase [Gilvimarinus algae]|uniref:N-(5'-phosphoribosyl)anthranilate isomerase n=1 Tax=Gilvimarinus algae TaxID=3058037 RepID=A0ABT8TJ84_9GAMM|nr:phosphoribosylanthranilate isomerase [Gilvimarinus sp. SDUM040014]MDO3384151.1 phosphoribosylanthranilate isomerase [Gilvimarinus sp. SDUM040014]
MRVKICGMTSVAQAEQAVAAGADAIGLVFYEKSPRHVNLALAADIASACGPFVTVVGLFVDTPREQLDAILRAVPLHLLQFHGNEPAEMCEAYGRPYMKALRMRPEMDVNGALVQYPTAAGVLLDAYRPGVPGGTGETFDWERFPETSPRPLVLAGGLTPDNVAEAVAVTRCYGVDVSGGVESSPGVKDPALVEQFITNAKRG